MEPLALLRRAVIGLLGTALAAGLLAAAAHANEVDASGRAAGIVLHGADETLRDYCREEDGALWLVLPGGARFELARTVSDPAIANPGDGSFHPFEFAQVRAALDQVRYPLGGVAAEVFLLPCPRRIGLDSAAGPGLILLSPGVRPIAAEQQQAEFTHELGHVVQYARMPDADTEAWDRYRVLRGIGDRATYSAAGIHANRPHEIFAEDFRALFGGSPSNYSGTVENAHLAPPEQVSGLSEFMLGLAGVTSQAARLSVAPNPSRGSIAFRSGSGTNGPLDLFDLAGRRVATLAPESSGQDRIWHWDGRDQSNRPVPAGMLLARVRGSAAPALRITRVP